MTNPTFILPSSPGIAANNLYALKVGNQPERFSPISGTFARSTTASRQNANGLIESIAINTPRLDYTYGSCPALLLEPQRTNVCLQSEDFSSASWAKSSSSVTANSTTAPDGNTTADSLIENTALGFHYATQLNVGSGTVSMSVYAKPNGRDWLYLHAYNGSGGDKGAYFNVSSGTIGTIDSGISASIQSASNGFYRCQITYTNANPMQIVLSLANANNGRSYTGDGTKGLYIWGAQSEVGAYPTTYIPTTSASVTRTADSFFYSNIFSSGFVGPAGGTWLVELKNNVAYTRDAPTRIGIADTLAQTVNSLLLSITSASGRLQIWKNIAGVTTSLYTTISDNPKIAIKWNGSTADIFVNGVKVVSSTVYTTTLMEYLNTSGIGLPIFIQQMALFNTPLPDAECVLLTSDTYGTFATLASSTSYTLS